MPFRTFRLPPNAAPPRDWFPPPGGFRFGLVTLPPDTDTMPEGLEMATALSEFEEKLPRMAARSWSRTTPACAPATRSTSS